MPGRPRCGAKTRTPDQHPCRRIAGHGTDHVGYGRCRLHGGRSPNGQKHGARLKALDVLAGYGVVAAPGVDPVDAMQNLLDLAMANVEVLMAAVTETGPEHLTDADGRPSALVALANEERDRASRLARDGVALGIVPRMNERNAEYGMRLYRAFVAAIDRAGLPREFHQPLREALAAELRELGAKVQPEHSPGTVVVLNAPANE